ncbi:cell division protein ZapA [Vermiphilus pyriformis]|jgi:hypothetical protein|uniref:Cell division protein ZapA n=1 Tax=candidate division TM6 bacterium JCVI TM6SC1 TaxID=1306947 RepID=A0A0D2I1C7_9BACT|nr:hypothetical protein J120_03710 [candidate division TM6 bacterium JCVI TM6SC1]UNE35551.1 MAG: cell division protein ZapA [Vermiphilus pyriformis]
MNELKKYTVTINSDMYSFISDEQETDIHRAVELVNSLCIPLVDIKLTSHHDSKRILALIAVRLASMLLQEQDQSYTTTTTCTSLIELINRTLEI